MITEDYVSFDTAKLLKEKGFNESTDKQFFISNKILGDYNITDRSRNPERYLDAPTIQMAMKWLREVHKLFILIEFSSFEYDKERQFVWSIGYKKVDGDYIGGTYHPTYENACEAAIKYCLEKLI